MQAEFWNSLISKLPGASMLQTYQWGQVKQQFGWQVNHLIWYQGLQHPIVNPDEREIGQKEEAPQAAALALQRSLRFPFLPISLSMIYLPKGPMFDWTNDSLRQRIISDIEQWARDQKAFMIKIDPDLRAGIGYPGDEYYTEDRTGIKVTHELKERGWQFSSEQVQFANTVVMDLSLDEDVLLSRMKQKTRYNIRLAERKGVQIRIGGLDDIPLLYKMYVETSLRDGFVIRDEKYYQVVWNTFFSSQLAEPLIASYNGEDIAALLLFFFNNKAWYLYGMSRMAHREKMPNYLLQWSAIKRAKQHGCEIYDLWGAPTSLDNMDPLIGVYRFKEGLGGLVERHIGAWDFPVKPQVYQLFTQAIPRVMSSMRRRSRLKMQQQTGF